ncbi:BRO1-like domain-containing protein [Myxozyma melibiosi]|uniref:BRO1-like domain-containing protein n=1 Tax=Myxozyma melibiosi TaxID=54550 RepID=A0ABR1FEZ7_9ASCO
MATNMLTVPLRRTEPIELGPAMRSYIENSYDQHPDMFKTDISALDSLRASIVELDLRAQSITTLTKYFTQLTFLSSKFPSTLFTFKWYSTLTYATSAAVQHPDLQFERANVLYNIAALHTLLAADENRTTPTGLKNAAQHFQSAAGCFLFLKESVNPELKLSPPEDLNNHTLDVLINLCLAQAQECFWQKAVVDGLKDKTIAKLAIQVSIFYSKALDATLKTSSIKSDWIHHITCKKHHFEAAAQYRAAADSLASAKYGDEIARIQLALEAVKRALASAKHVSPAVADDLKGLQTKLKSDLARAEKDNDLIYLVMVPSLSTMPPLKGAVTVSAAVPPEIKDTSEALKPGSPYGPPLFIKLVPFAAHQAASIYVDRRDTLINHLIINKIDVLTAQLHEFLTRMGLPGSLQALERPVGLPPSLIAHAAEVRASGGYTALKASIEDVRNLAQMNNSMYVAAAETLEAERKEDDDMRARYGTSGWRRLTSREAAKEQYARLEQFAAALKTASASDETVRATFRENEQVLRLLSEDPSVIEKYVPSGSSAELSPELEKRLEEMRSKMAQVSRLEYARRKFVEQVREKATNDDVTDLVLSESARLEQLDPLGKIDPSMFEKAFTDRLASLYDADKARVEKETEEQSALLVDIELANMDFSAAVARSRGDVSTERERALQSLEAGYYKYQELAEHLSEGRKFYNELSGALAQLQDEVSDFVYSRRVQLRDEESELAARFESINISREQRSESPLPAPRAQGLPAAVLSKGKEGGSGVWNPEMGIQFGKRF